MVMKKESFNSDKRWVETFEPEIKQILGETFVSTANFERDAKEATDLIVLQMKPFTVACRVRRFLYFEKYSEEFTIRSKRPGEVKTEIQKIMEGWGDYLFYGFADETEKSIFSYFIADLKVFRQMHGYYRYPLLDVKTKLNEDGSSEFKIYKIEAFPENFILKRMI